MNTGTTSRARAHVSSQKCVSLALSSSLSPSTDISRPVNVHHQNCLFQVNTSRTHHSHTHTQTVTERFPYTAHWRSRGRMTACEKCMYVRAMRIFICTSTCSYISYIYIHVRAPSCRRQKHTYTILYVAYCVRCTCKVGREMKIYLYYICECVCVCIICEFVRL